MSNDASEACAIPFFIVKEFEDMYEFHELLLEDCITKHQRSKIDSYEDYYFPMLDKIGNNVNKINY